MQCGTNMNWVAIARTVTLPSAPTVVPRFCSANSPDRCNVLGSMCSTLLGGLMLMVSAVNTIMPRMAATSTPTPNAHSNSLPRIRRSCVGPRWSVMAYHTPTRGRKISGSIARQPITSKATVVPAKTAAPSGTTRMTCASAASSTLSATSDGASAAEGWSAPIIGDPPHAPASFFDVEFYTEVVKRPAASSTINDWTVATKPAVPVICVHLPANSHRSLQTDVSSNSRGGFRQSLQHRDPCPGDDRRRPGGAYRDHEAQIAANATYDRSHDRNSIGATDGACLRGGRLVDRVRAYKCRTGRGRYRVFRVRQLHDARIRRRRSRGALATDRTDNGDERHARVRLVDRRHFRGPAKNNSHTR